jgi:hypothetical protein
MLAGGDGALRGDQKKRNATVIATATTTPNTTRVNRSRIPSLIETRLAQPTETRGRQVARRDS